MGTTTYALKLTERVYLMHDGELAVVSTYGINGGEVNTISVAENQAALLVLTAPTTPKSFMEALEARDLGEL